MSLNATTVARSFSPVRGREAVKVWVRVKGRPRVGIGERVGARCTR